MNRKPSFFKKSCTLSAAILMVSLILAGCSSTGGTTSGVSAGAAFDSIREGVAMKAKKVGSIVLTKGITKSEVVALMGDPAEIEHVFRNGAVGEIWTYKRSIYEGTKSNVMGTQTSVSANSITGEVTSISTGTVSQLEELSSLATTELLFDEDTLVAFKENVEKGIVRVVNR